MNNRLNQQKDNLKFSISYTNPGVSEQFFQKGQSSKLSCIRNTQKNQIV
jgi:hypothetical protein